MHSLLRDFKAAPRVDTQLTLYPTIYELAPLF